MKVGLYYDIFKLFTMQHADIVEQALRILDKVVIVLQPPVGQDSISMYGMSAKIHKYYKDNPNVSVAIQITGSETLHDIRNEYNAEYTIHPVDHEYPKYMELCHDVDSDYKMQPLFFMHSESVRKYTSSWILQMHLNSRDLSDVIIAGQLPAHYSSIHFSEE